MKWELANSGGIEVDPASNSWHAGRIYDMLKISIGRILVGTSNAGVWVISLEDGNAIPLSLDWDNPNVTCLAFGPGGSRIFAGCGSGGALYETDFSDPLDPRDPIYKPWRSIPLDPKIGSITDITVLPNNRVIVLACWGGIIWSFIPGLGGTYDWQMAEWSGGSEDDVPHFGDSPPPCFSVTLGLGSTIVAGAWSTEREPKKQGIYWGAFFQDGLFPTGKLNMHTAKIHGWSPIKGQPAQAAMARVSVASCPSQPKYVYALSTQPYTGPDEWQKAGQVNMVLRSEDGGLNWNTCGGLIPEAPKGIFASWLITEYGDAASGGEMHAISVSPHNPDHVAFGISVPFISTDKGYNWQPLRPWFDSKPEIDHFHSDIHFIYFDPNWADQLFIGSDGGIISTTNKGSTFRSIYNKNLYNLLFYSTTASREFYGTLAASSWSPNIIAGGLHDNGNVYCMFEKVEGHACTTGLWIKTPWKRLDYGDGGQVVCTTIDGLVLHSQEAHSNDTTERSATFDTPKYELVDRGTVPVRSPEGVGISDFIPWIRMEKIFDPVFKNKQGQLMYAVAAANPLEQYTRAVPGTDVRVFGLFANPDGKDIHWEPISGSYWFRSSGAGFGKPDRAWLFDEYIPAVGSYDGRLVFLSRGMFVITVDTLPPHKENKVHIPSVLPGDDIVRAYNGNVYRFAIESSTLAYAAYNREDGRGFLIRTRNGGRTWEHTFTTGLPEETIFGLDYDDNTIPKTLYVATDRQVWVSKDEGITWNDFSDGLPRCPKCADLRFVRYPDGSRFLYLSTWGWSVWRVKLS